MQWEAKSTALHACEQGEVAFGGQVMNPWQMPEHLQAAEEARAGHGTMVKAETQRMGVLGEHLWAQQKPFPREKGHGASSPKGTWLARVPGECGSCEAATV